MVAVYVETIHGAENDLKVFWIPQDCYEYAVSQLKVRYPHVPLKVPLWQNVEANLAALTAAWEEEPTDGFMWFIEKNATIFDDYRAARRGSNY